MFDRAHALLRGGRHQQLFPAAVAEVGTSAGVLWREAVGHFTYDPASPPTRVDTVFDLASLTKVLATTPLVMHLMARGGLTLDDPVSHHLPSWTGADRVDVTIRDLLAHCSGLPAHQPYFQAHSGRAAYEAAICAEALDYAPRTTSAYSDLGFMLLGFIAEDRLGASLAEAFVDLSGRMAPGQRLRFAPPPDWASVTAPGAIRASGEPARFPTVDDATARALGGVAGHAGLFGTAPAVGACARQVLQDLSGLPRGADQALLAEFVTRRADIPGSSRALGWDTMLPTSSCGTRLSPRAFGHTGFTGTSLWIDPDRDLYVVLLTNRLHPDGPRDGLQAVRAAFHDAVVDGLALTT